jgi:hypothetical protein
MLSGKTRWNNSKFVVSEVPQPISTFSAVLVPQYALQGASAIVQDGTDHVHTAARIRQVYYTSDVHRN